MSKKISITIFFLLILLVNIPSVGAQNKTSDIIGNQTSSFLGTSGLIINEPADIVSVIIRSVLSLLGIIFLVLTLYAGYLWMTANGNEDQVGKAKDILKAAVIGLIIVAAAYSITYFVFQSLSGATGGGGGGNQPIP